MGEARAAKGRRGRGGRGGWGVGVWGVGRGGDGREGVWRRGEGAWGGLSYLFRVWGPLRVGERGGAWGNLGVGGPGREVTGRGHGESVFFV